MEYEVSTTQNFVKWLAYYLFQYMLILWKSLKLIHIFYFSHDLCLFALATIGFYTLQILDNHRSNPNVNFAISDTFLVWMIVEMTPKDVMSTMATR
jgi:hypothetical protein